MRELPPSGVLNVPAKNTPAWAIAAILPLFLICFDHICFPSCPVSLHGVACVCLWGPHSHPGTMSCPESQGKGRERLPGVVPSSLLQTHITPLLLVSQLQLKTSLGTMEVSADPQHKGAFSASPPLCTHTHRAQEGEPPAVTVSSIPGGDRQETRQTQCAHATTDCLWTSTALLRVPRGRL